MYSVPSRFEIPAEVAEFRRDTEALGMIGDLDRWYVTPEWANRFQAHLAKILPIAQAGNPWAQYSVASLYMCGYLYSTRDDRMANHDKDAEVFSLWLEKCARQGFVAAVDNLITDGVGVEADRLRRICRAVESQSFIPHDEQGIPVYPPSICERVWQLAYGDDS